MLSSSPTFCTECLIHANDLNGMLSARPRTKCTQTKKNRDGSKKYEYRKCCCGGSYRITLTHEGDMILFKESSLPASHDSSSDMKPPSSLRVTDEVHRWLDYLAHRHLFDPNYGVKKVVRQLRTEFGVSEELIPSDWAINNRLAYYHRTIGQHTNKIEVVEVELCRYVFTGDEEVYQPFIYLYDTDEDGR